MAQDLSLDDELYERFAREFEPETVDDLILLGEPTDVRVTEKLRNRYNKKKFYTYIGPTVVAVNPYEKTDLYSLDVKSFYHRRQPYELAPHLYSLAEDAYKHMMETGTNQAIVISGESGAGKTESAKIVMDYIAQLGLSGIASENIRKIMLESNPLLEAFGNAKTLRNDNSSRFGKFIDLYFSFKGHMEGGNITTCLLEKARVVEQRKGERNFHIFYQLCADDQMRESLGLGNASKFNYLNKNEITVKGINDKAGFKATNDAMRECSISESERSQIYKLCAAILHMGNIKFRYKNASNPNEGVEVENPDALKKTALLLEVEEDTLREAMSSRTIYIAGKEGQKTAQTPEKAETARDTLAKGIYERLFQWLIRRINASVKRPEEARQCIGILDIYGFEIYQTNSLEQLNINFVNEKIQQQIQKWLQEEQDEYIEEGVPNFKLTKLFNCDPCVKLVEDKPYGIYAFLDEETLFPGGNDENYLAKMNSAFEKNSSYEVSRFKSLNFGLQHFVTQVTYSVKGWVEKNRDTLYGDLILAMRTSRNEFVNSLFPVNERLPQKDKLQRTISQQFKEDVGQVVGKLKSKRLHFIKCIKPNHDKKPSEFTEDLVKDQVKYLGLCENIHVRTSGYYFKMPYDKFLGRYKLCSDKTFPRFHGSAREGCEHIIKDMQLQGRFAFGKTKIFLSSPVQLFALDERIQSKRGEMAAIIQRNYKKYKSHQVRMEKQHLTRALEQTYGEKSEPILKQTFNTITLKAERLRQMLVVCPENMYIVDPKSWCVLRRVPLHKIQKVSYSNLSDGLVIVGVEGQYDLVMEVDKKQEIIKLLKETYEGHTSKTLKVENKEEFQFCPRKGITKALKFVKNFGAKATVIEAIPEGLQVSIKPSEDIYNGEKKRRKASFTKAYHGDYIRLQHSELMKTLEKEHGDKFVSFSGVVAKYNKHYKKQERILMITERAMYNIDPNGYIVNRRIELRRIKGASVSPFTDNYFILHVPDEYDYVFESSKKTEILKALVENYTASTRGTIKVAVKPDIAYKYSKKDPNAAKLMHWEESVDYPETTLVPSKEGADIFVLPEDVMSRHMKSAVVQDIYMGQKMRRKESLYKNYLGDYLHLSSHKVMAKIAKKYGENKLLYSGVVSKINNRYVVQDRKLLITEGAIYNLDREGFGINRRIPLKSVKSIMVSTLKDGFFVLRVPDEYDYLFASPNKTEIIKTILDAQKRLVGSEGVNKPIEVIVDDTILYSPFHPSKGKGIRTIEFKSDDAVKLPTIFPTPTGVLVKVNINFDEGDIDSEINDDSKEAQAKWGLKDDGLSIYQGRKRRNKRSKSREELGDYLRLKESPNLKALLKQFGDQELLFSSEVNKINKKFKSQNRVVIITEKALYNIDPENFKLRRRIPLENIDGISVSSLTDGHFVLHMPKEYDYFMESDKKTEIINVLSRAMKRGQKDLTINVADKFEFCPSGDDVCSVSFVLDENNDDSFIESTHNGLVVHVQHNEPGVILEAAYVHIKDQQKPIEIKNSQTLIKLSKKWKYKLEIRFYVSEHLQGSSFVEKIDTVTQRQEFKSQIGDLEPREERYVIMLPERQVLHSLFSKTRVKAKLIDPLGRVLLAVRFTYDVK